VNYKHGMRHTRVYRIWCGMKNRCTNPNEEAFKDYGARGITVCARWSESFEAFYADMGDCGDNLSIERVNNDKGYEPGNCIWATRVQQARNKRSTRLLTAEGISRTPAEWAEISGLKLRTIMQRLTLGWSEQDAVTHPIVKQRAGTKRGERLHSPKSFGAEHEVRFSAPEWIE